MKNVLIGLLLSLSVTAHAQERTEPKVLGEAKQLMAEYVPIGEYRLQFKAYLISVDTFLSTIQAYKTKAYDMIDRSDLPANDKPLAKKDVDYYALSQLYNYRLYYGADSAKQAAYMKMLETTKDFTVIDSARKAAQVKVLTPAERVLLDSLCNKAIDLNDSTLFVYSGAYRSYLSEWVSRMIYSEFRNQFSVRLDLSLMKLMVANKYITDPHIRNYFSYSLTGLIIKTSKDSTLKDSVYHAFVATSTKADYRKKIDSVYANYLAFGIGRPAPDFTYTTVNGKKVSLKSLRGKYIYIDVWATWCVPCKKEIPFLMEVEKKYEGRNIQFISLSVDVPKDKEKWRKYVLENHLEGLQLITENGFDSDFIKKFNIASIPRFILIDPAGKIIAADAKRPSDPALQKQLDGLIAMAGK